VPLLELFVELRFGSSDAEDVFSQVVLNEKIQLALQRLENLDYPEETCENKVSTMFS